jgi:hypothetical protein
MQQEAAYLACTAIGLGTCIFNLGVEGTERGDRFATTRQLILRKVDSLGFSTSPPGPEKPFKKGRNLTEPKRDGNRACLTELRLLTLSKNTGTMANEADISQMLWAARGRTPHYVKSHPWGITIPTWGGVQNHTSVYLWKENNLFQYVNWTTPFFRLWWVLGNPTHDIKLVKNVNVGPDLNDATAAIILTENEKTNRALWEAGYMLENMFLQTRSVGISYEAKVFTDCEIERLKRSGVTGAVAAVLL